MHKPLGVQEVLANVALDMHFVLPHVRDLGQHEAAVLLPRDVIRVENRDVSQQRVRVVLNARLRGRVQRHVAELVSELRLKHALEQFLHLSLLATRNVLQVLQNSHETWHSLRPNEAQRFVAHLVDSFCVLKRVLFDTLHVRGLARLDHNDDVGNFCDVHHTVRVFSLDFLEDQSLFSRCHIGSRTRVRAQVGLVLACCRFLFLHQSVHFAAVFLGSD